MFKYSKQITSILMLNKLALNFYLVFILIINNLIVNKYLVTAGTTYITPSAPLRSNTDSSSVPGVNSQIYSGQSSIQMFELPSGGMQDIAPVPFMGANPSLNSNNINDFNNKKNDLTKLNHPDKLNNKSNPITPLRSMINTQSSINQGNSSVDSFFDIKPVQSVNIDPQFKANIKVHKLNKAGTIIWHTLDNLGVPMFVNIDNPIDPSLAKPIESKQLDNSLNPNIQNNNQPPIEHKKLPGSELEGIDNNNDIKAK